MRDLGPEITALLASGRRIEPVTVIAMYVGSQPIEFADRDLYAGDDPTHLTTPGRILEVGNLEEAQRSDSTGMAGSVSVVLDDRDGDLKALFDGVDLHKKKVNVYQTFVGVQDRFLVFSGQVSTPLVWDEGKRTFGFDVVSKLEDFEVGWSAEMGNYATLPQEMLGKPWPMVFGTVHHSPCIRLQNIPTAFTTEPFGIIDRQLESEVPRLKNLLELAISATIFYSMKATDDIPWAALGAAHDAVSNDPKVKQYIQMQVDLQEQIIQAGEDLSWQTPYVLGAVNLVPTVYVTQPYSGPFRIGNSLFEGNLRRDGGSISTVPTILPGSPAGPDVREGFQFFSAGSQAVIAGHYPMRYVASVTPGTVLKVWAMRSFNGVRQMAEVPRAYYSIETHPIGRGMVATYVVLGQPLSTRAMVENMKTQTWENSFGKNLPSHIVNQIDWEDDLYVSFRSAVGPNPVDIMEWVVANFSGNGFDAASFDAVRDRAGLPPMNFTMASLPQVMSFLGEIAYQAKCLVYLKEDTFHLIYLPATPTPVDEITEDDIMVDSLQVACTPTEELVTKYSASFRPDYSPFFDEPVRLITRYNIPKYGVQEESHDFYCYNNYAPVQDASTFWIIRKSQSYKLLRARLLLTKLNLEVFDHVTLNFATPYVANQDVVGMITKCRYDTENRWIDVEIWCPVILGEMAESRFAWPEGASQQVQWPQYHALAGGGGAGLSSPQMPPSNPRTEEVGTVAVGGPPIGRTSVLGPIDWGTPNLGFVVSPADMPRSKAFPWTPQASPDPTKDYKFKAKPNPEIELQDGMYPGTVKEKVDGTHYMVDVYENGMKAKPRPRKVQQLQIDEEDTIPEGTWVFVSARQGMDESDEPYMERTMQVPTWLE